MPWSQRWSPLLVVLAAASGLHFSACTPAGKVTSSTTPTYKPDYVAGGNRWSFKAYDNSDPDHTTLVSAQVLCFEYAGTAGNHIKYTWYSETFPGWSGSAIQEGDEIFLHGDYANGV